MLLVELLVTPFLFVSMLHTNFQSTNFHFEGSVVVCGGDVRGGEELKSVERYDACADRWSRMPSMNTGKSNHGLAVVRGKLFAVGGRENSCEVFDGEKFVSLKSPSLFLNRAVSIGNKLLLLKQYDPAIACYDVTSEEWSEVASEKTKHLAHFSCVKVPCF